MLSIRMQRKGRTGHAQFRVIVQDSRFHPTSGRVVAYVGSYDPHTKAATLDGEKISQYLSNGAQPSDRVAKLLTKEGIKLPDWFQASAPKSKTVRNADKRRSTRPTVAPEPEAKTEEVAKTPAEAVKEPETTDSSTDMSSEALAKNEASAEAEAPAENAETPVADEAPAADSSTEALAKAEEPAVEPEVPTEPAPTAEAEKPAQ